MDVYVPYNVYCNLIKLMGYRGIKPRDNPMDEDQVVQRLNHYEYIIMIGDRDEDLRGKAECYIILIAPNSKYSTKSQDFKKLLKLLPKKNEELEVMFVSSAVFTTHLKKALYVFKTESPRIYVEDYDYEKFMIEAPKHVLVPEHILTSEQEIQTFCKKYYTTRDKFPKILVTDTPAVWLGLKVGMVVKIRRVSETAGEAIAYRICVRG